MSRFCTSVSLIAFVLMIPSTAAAQSELAKQLEGKWKIDAEKTKPVLTEAVGAEEAEQLLSLLAEFSVTFMAEGKAEITFSGQPRGASWETVEQNAEEKTLKIKVVPDDGVDNDNVTTVKFLSKDSFRMSSEQEEEVMIFARVKNDDQDEDNQP